MIRLQNMGRCSMLRIGCLCWCVLAATAGARAQVVAHVLDVMGDWHLQGTATTVALGQALMAGAKITSGSNRPGDAITIVRDEDMSRQRIACNDSASNPCRNPITVDGGSSAAPAGESQLKNMVQTALAVLLNKPPAIMSHYALTMSRGNATVQEWEEVVSLDPVQGIVLPAAPQDMPSGQYTVSIERARDASPVTQQTLLLTSAGTWKPLSLGAAGLYEALITDANGEQVADAFLLVVPAAEYEAKRREFDTVKSRTAAWTGPSARADEHLFLLAVLLSRCPAC
jgi:hypothetical protein